MVNRNVLIGVGIVIGATVIAAAYLRSVSTTPNPSKIPDADGAFIAIDKSEITSEAKKRPSNIINAPKTGTVAPIDYKRSFTEARNYWEYAKRILPAAKAGNPDAQFYLSRVISRCMENNKMYFQRRAQTLTLDEGLQFAVQRHLSIEVAQEVYEKCHDMQGSDLAELGSAEEWLTKATARGQPIAQATTASNILTRELQRNFAAAGGVSDPDTEKESKYDGPGPRELLRMAVQSKDPEVLFSIGDAQALLNPSNVDNTVNRLAWWLIACERGLDCSASASWVENTCSGDPSCEAINTPAERVRSLAGDNWPNVQQRAREINDKLNADQWNELGIGS